jgi:hypothetical protein
LVGIQGHRSFHAGNFIEVTMTDSPSYPEIGEAQMAADFATIPDRSDGPMHRARALVENYSSRIGAVHIERLLIEAIATEIGLAELRATPHRADPKHLLQNVLSLSPAEQHRLAFLIAENIGYVLTREPDHPDSPHGVAQAVPDYFEVAGKLGAALVQIAGMDPKECRADDLGRAARIAREALAPSVPSTDPRCTCAAIVNPNIPHARTCPLASPESK